jgi:hypothetical protein
MTLTELFTELLTQSQGKLKPYTLKQLEYLLEASREGRSIFNQHFIRLAWKDVLPELKALGLFKKYEGNEELRESLKGFVK